MTINVLLKKQMDKFITFMAQDYKINVIYLFQNTNLHACNVMYGRLQFTSAMLEQDQIIFESYTLINCDFATILTLEFE